MTQSQGTGLGQAGWKACTRNQWSPQSHNLQPDHGGRSTHTCNTVLASQLDVQITHVIILTDSMNLLQKVESGMGCPDWHTAMHSLRLQAFLWIYCPRHVGVSGNKQADRLTTYLLTPIAPGGAQAINDPSPSHSLLGCSGHSRPVGHLLFQLYFSVLPPTVARPASLSLPQWAPGQGLVCSAGCWLPEGVSDPAPLPPQYLLGHWFLLCFSRVHS